MKFLITLEQTEIGFSVQAPDLAIVTHGKNIDDAKQAAIKAIKINMEAYIDAGKDIPENEPAAKHLSNPDFAGLLFAYVNVHHENPTVAV